MLVACIYLLLQISMHGVCFLLRAIMHLASSCRNLRVGAICLYDEGGEVMRHGLSLLGGGDNIYCLLVYT